MAFNKTVRISLDHFYLKIFSFNNRTFQQRMIYFTKEIEFRLIIFKNLTLLQILLKFKKFCFTFYNFKSMYLKQ